MAWRRKRNGWETVTFMPPAWRRAKNDPAIFIAGSGKGLIGHGPKSLRVARRLYAGIGEILLDGSDILRLLTVSIMTFSVMK
jgi:hypothetical protein